MTTPLKSIVTAAITLSFFTSSVASATTGNGPSHTIGCRAYAGVTGSGHGLYYSPGIYYEHKRDLVAAGPLLGENSWQIAGVHAGYERNVLRTGGREGKLDMFFFTSAMYRPGARLTQSALRMEEKENQAIVAQMKFKTVEVYAGIGLKVKLTKRLMWANSIGFGGYYSVNCPLEINHDRATACLMMRTGMYFDLYNGSAASF